MNKKITKLIAALALLVFMTPSMVGWGQTTISTSDFTWPTPQISENFNSLTETTTTSPNNSATEVTSGYGEFNYLSVGKSGTSKIITNNTFGSKVMELTAGGGSPVIAKITGKTFSTTGAFSLKIAKTDNSYFGLYANTNNTELAHADASVYLRLSSGTLSIHNSGTSANTGWTTIGSSYSTDIIEVYIVYNNTTSQVTYGGNISLGSKRAHVFVNGLCVMDGDNPKEFVIPGSNLTVFRALPIALSGNVCTVDDVVIYNALPTAPSGPTITADPTEMEFTYASGGSAANQNLTITGSDLTAGITATITEGASYFSISEDEETWATTLSLSADGDLIAVRLNSGITEAGTYNGTLTLSSTGATDVTVSLTGIVTPPTHDLSKYSDNIEHGSISFSPQSPIEEGATVTLTATPDDGYELDSWTFYKEGDSDFEVDESITVENNTFTMPAYDLWVDATFSAKQTYAIGTEVTPENSGTIETDANAWEGKEVLVLVEPASGYIFSSIVVSKTSDPSTTITTSGNATDGFTFEMPAYPVTVTATFAEIVVHTVAWALENTPSTGVYVQGIVSSFFGDDIMDDDQNFRYYISDNGGTYNGELLVYKGKDLGNVAFDDVNDLLIGDVVIIFGDLFNYQGTKEFNAGNYIVSKTRPVHSPYNLTIPEWVNFELFAFTGPDSEGAFDYSDDEAAHWGTVQVNDGTQVMLSISANQHYTFESLYVDGVDVTSQLDDSGVYFFMMPTHNVTITATAAPINVTYKYSINGVEGTPISVLEGSTIDLDPGSNFNEEYTFAGWTTNATDVSQHLTGEYTLSEEETTFYAVYAKTGTETLVENTVVLDGSKFGSTQPSSPATLTSDNITYTYIGAKQQIIQNTAQNYFTNTSAFLIGKNGKYLYNTTAFGEGITNFEIYNNRNASTSVEVGVCFSTESLTQYVSGDNTWELKLSSDDHQYVVPDNTIPSGAKYFYFKIRSDHNAQVQFRITYNTISSTTSYYTRVMTKEISKDQWCFIASPMGTAPVNMDEITDLYFYDEATHYWKNKEVEANAEGFNFALGKGYLAAYHVEENPQDQITITFAGTSVCTDNTKTVDVTYHGTDNPLAGWNLVGNPYPHDAYLGQSFYTVAKNAQNKWVVSAVQAGSPVASCTGAMVQVASDVESITFSKSPTAGANNSSLQMTVGQQTMERGSVSTVDNAIVSFNEGNELQKFYFGNANANLYIPQNDKEYAILSAEAQGELPLNFRANENGQYTLTVNPEGVEMNYLHLIDNMTGNDIDLLQTPSYSFNATTRDYESRFRLVFAANNEDGVSTGSTTFAYYSNGNWMVNNEGEASLQVIDVMGRVLSNQTISGTAELNLNQVPGVYVLRLVNGNDVKTQKIVVR